jgi:hypothetical protein
LRQEVERFLFLASVEEPGRLELGLGDFRLTLGGAIRRNGGGRWSWMVAERLEEGVGEVGSADVQVVPASSVVVEELFGRDAVAGQELADGLAALGRIGFAADHIDGLALRVKRALNAADVAVVLLVPIVAGKADVRELGFDSPFHRHVGRLGGAARGGGWSWGAWVGDGAVEAPL